LNSIVRKKTKLSKNHLVFIVRVVLKSKNDCAEKSEVKLKVTFNSLHTKYTLCMCTQLYAMSLKASLLLATKFRQELSTIQTVCYLLFERKQNQIAICHCNIDLLYRVSMRVSVEKLFSHTAVDAPNVIADANSFSVVETQHGTDTTLVPPCLIMATGLYGHD
jgi:hypothetical protein